MSHKIRCPNCSKGQWVTEADAGLSAVCAACGARFQVLPPPLAPDPTSSAVATLSRRQRHPWFGGARTLLVLGCIALAALASVWGVSLYQADQRHEQKTHAVQLKSQAEMLAAEGDLRGAHEKYVELAGYLADLRPDQPELQSLAASARADQDRVYRLLLRPGDREPAPTDVHSPATAPVAAAPPEPTPPAAPPQSRPSVTADLVPAAAPPPAAAVTPPLVSGPPARPVRVLAPPQPEPAEPDAITDERIGNAVQRGANYLISQFDPVQFQLKSQLGDRGAFYSGMDALCVYALLQSGQAIPDTRLGVHSDFMKGLIEAMKRLPIERGPVTYARAIRATALAVYDRPEDRTALHADAVWLMQATSGGGYSYDKAPNARPNFGGTDAAWDNSNSQYGLLGVWSAAETGVEVPAEYWRVVEKHWTESQLHTGEWPYRAGESGRLSMTDAGIASLFVTHDYLDPSRSGAHVGRDPFTPALSRGLAWLEKGNNAVTLSEGWWGYWLYGVERVGLASGFKYFGTHDWYRELARQALRRQHANGSWGRPEMDTPQQTLIDTAYALLFLARGRHPVMLNKLRFDGSWANHPRDAANLSRYASQQLERPLNWQVASLNSDWSDWTDSPILYLASQEPLKLTEKDYEKLRSFIRAGGLLLTQADGDSAAFNRFVTEMAPQVCPGCKLVDVPRSSELYSLVFKLNVKPPLQMVSNGARILMLHSPTDLARAWQSRDPKLKRENFELGVNIFVYTTGKRDLRNRLEPNFLPPDDSAPLEKTPVARLQYEGGWDPEPYAWTRFSRWFQKQTSYKVEPVTVTLAQLRFKDAPIAHLTGIDRHAFTTTEVEAVRQYVLAGGVLLIDSCGGGSAFEESARTDLLAKAFPEAAPREMSSDDPILQGGTPGMDDLRHPKLRVFNVERAGLGGGLPMSFNAGKGRVIDSTLDITSGLLNTGTWGILGYDPSYAQSLIKNLILWSMNRGTP